MYKLEDGRSDASTLISDYLGLGGGEKLILAVLPCLVQGNLGGVEGIGGVFLDPCLAFQRVSTESQPLDDFACLIKLFRGRALEMFQSALCVNEIDRDLVEIQKSCAELAQRRDVWIDFEKLGSCPGE